MIECFNCEKKIRKPNPGEGAGEHVKLDNKYFCLACGIIYLYQLIRKNGKV
jgi:hypothetical protein